MKKILVVLFLGLLFSCTVKETPLVVQDPPPKTEIRNLEVVGEWGTVYMLHHGKLQSMELESGHYQTYGIIAKYENKTYYIAVGGYFDEQSMLEVMIEQGDFIGITLETLKRFRIEHSSSVFHVELDYESIKVVEKIDSSITERSDG